MSEAGSKEEGTQRLDREDLGPGTRVPVPALPLTHCVTSGKLPNLSVSQLPPLPKENSKLLSLDCREGDQSLYVAAARLWARSLLFFPRTFTKYLLNA